MIVVLVAAGAACSGSGVVTTQPTGTTSSTAAPGAGDTRPINPDCLPATLLTPVRAKFAAATLEDVVCATDRAAATVVGAAELGGDGVALLSVVDRQWTLIANGPVTADPATLIPAKFSVVVYDTWFAKYQSRTNPTTTTATTPGTTTDPATSSTTSTTSTTRASSGPTTSRPRCFELGGRTVCYDGPPSTTTAPPITTPDGKIVTTTTASTTPPVTSMFCKFNYRDPRCAADPTTPG